MSIWHINDNHRPGIPCDASMSTTHATPAMLWARATPPPSPPANMRYSAEVEQLLHCQLASSPRTRGTLGAWFHTDQHREPLPLMVHDLSLSGRCGCYLSLSWWEVPERVCVSCNDQAGTASIPETAFLELETRKERDFVQKSTSGRFAAGSDGKGDMREAASLPDGTLLTACSST